MAHFWHDWTVNRSSKKWIYTVSWALICLSINQTLEHIYSIVDADLYTIHEEMLTLVELHIIHKKCSRCGEQQN